MTTQQLEAPQPDAPTLPPVATDLPAAPLVTSPTRPSWRLPRRRGGYLDGASSAGSRLIGIDAARGVAILGMMAAHVGMTTSGITTFEGWLAFAHGRSSILFAVIAGFSLGLLTGATRPHTGEKMVRSRLRILVRSALLLGVAALLQLLGTPVSIIIGFYAVWFAVALPFVNLPAKRLFILAGATAILGGIAKVYLPWLLASLGMDPVNTFSANGAVTEFMLTGIYPGVVWMAFIFLGLGLSRIDWSSARRLVALLAVGVMMAVMGHVGSYILTGWLSPDQQPQWSLTVQDAGTSEWVPSADDLPMIEQDIVDGWMTQEEASQILNAEQLAEVSDGIVDGVTLTPKPGSPNGPALEETTAAQADANVATEQPGTGGSATGGQKLPDGPGWRQIPPPAATDLLPASAHSNTPFEAVGNSGVALAIIAALCLIARRGAWVLAPLATVGAMSLTIYSAHVVAIWAANPFGAGMASSDNSFYFGMVGVAIAFAMAWRLIWARGPLEHVLHVISVRSTLPPSQEGRPSATVGA